MKNQDNLRKIEIRKHYNDEPQDKIESMTGSQVSVRQQQIIQDRIDQIRATHNAELNENYPNAQAKIEAENRKRMRLQEKSINDLMTEQQILPNMQPRLGQNVRKIPINSDKKNQLVMKYGNVISQMPDAYSGEVDLNDEGKLNMSSRQYKNMLDQQVEQKKNMMNIRKMQEEQLEKNSESIDQRFFDKKQSHIYKQVTDSRKSNSTVTPLKRRQDSNMSDYERQINMKEYNQLLEKYQENISSSPGAYNIRKQINKVI